MWKSESVERALFHWSRWRCSLIKQWCNLEDELAHIEPEKVKITAKITLDKLNLQHSTWLQLYWICCVASDYSIDNEGSFKGIVVPNWLQIPFDKTVSLDIKPNMRMCPPAIYMKVDLEKLGRFLLVLNDEELGKVMDWEGLILPPDHDFCYFLKNQRGKPKKQYKPSKRKYYSDRLSVKSAILKVKHGLSYVKIAKKLGLPITRPYESDQSNAARSLVNRGKKLLYELCPTYLENGLL